MNPASEWVVATVSAAKYCYYTLAHFGVFLWDCSSSVVLSEGVFAGLIGVMEGFCDDYVIYWVLFMIRSE